MIFFLKKESKMIALLVKSKINIFIYHTMFRSLEVYQRSWNENLLLFTVICVQAYVGLKSR